MKLEIIKFKMTRYLKGVGIANITILGLILISYFFEKDVLEMMTSHDNVVSLTGSIVRAVFTIFAAVLISRIVISEYKNKTINILFMYPISRKKILVAKFMIVVIFTFTSILFSSLFLNATLLILNCFVHFIEEPLTQGVLMKNLIDIVVYSAAFGFLSLITSFVGMLKKSGSATIVTSVVLVCLLGSGSNGNTLSSIFIVQIILVILGAGAAYLSIKDVEKVDVINF